jgi:hypothetical protein
LGEFFGFDAALFAHGLQDRKLSGVEGHGRLLFQFGSGFFTKSDVSENGVQFFDTIKKESL